MGKDFLGPMRNTPQRLTPANRPPAMPDDTTIADDTTRTLPPAHQHKLARKPHGKAPRWPLSGKASGRPHGSAYSRNAQAPAPPRPAPVVDSPRDLRVY